MNCSPEICRWAPLSPTGKVLYPSPPCALNTTKARTMHPVVQTAFSNWSLPTFQNRASYLASPNNPDLQHRQLQRHLHHRHPNGCVKTGPAIQPEPHHHRTRQPHDRHLLLRRSFTLYHDQHHPNHHFHRHLHPNQQLHDRHRVQDPRGPHRCHQHRCYQHH